MLARFGIGAAVAALPAAAAITGAAAGWSPWVVGAFTLLALVAVFVVPPAPYLRWLNRLPLIGSPKFRIEVRFNGRLDDMRLRVGEWANTSVLSIEVENLARAAVVKDAWMNLLVPSGIRMGRSDKVGAPIDGGRWEPFHWHRLGSHTPSDYWNDGGWTFEPGVDRLLRFKLRLRQIAPANIRSCSSSAPQASTGRWRSPGRSTSRTHREATSTPRTRWAP